MFSITSVSQQFAALILQQHFLIAKVNKSSKAFVEKIHSCGWLSLHIYIFLYLYTNCSKINTKNTLFYHCRKPTVGTGACPGSSHQIPSLIIPNKGFLTAKHTPQNWGFPICIFTVLIFSKKPPKPCQNNTSHSKRGLS